MPNKIKYGLKNVHYAVATIAADGSATFATPKPIPGAVSMSLDPQGEMEPFYADNIVYFVSNSNSGYEGDMEFARLTEDFKKDILGYIEDSKGVLLEDVDAEATHFALLFQFEGDVKATRHVLYNCTANRASVSGNTKEENTTPQTESCTISSTSIYVPTLQKNLAKAETNPETDSATYEGWNSEVYIPTSLTAGEEVPTSPTTGEGE